MEDNRPNPDLLLEKLKKEEARRVKENRGKLKIFLGYAAGVGKTYTMLEAAHLQLESGVDVLSGYVEPHARPETLAMEKGLPKLPPRLVTYKGIELRELDLDEALLRRPRLLLVDELAHTNAEGLRHQKRYQDVEELLEAGIDVYTTVNIQHLESLNDRVGSITGVQVRERIPDNIFDQADQVEVIDIEPDDLLKRLRDGKIYKSDQAERAAQHFFVREKLIALREISLRRAADRVNHMAILEREERGARSYYTGEHVMTCISPSPTCAKVIRSASRLAYAFNGEFTALYVSTPRLQEADVRTKKLLEDHMHLAQALGAKIATVYGEDVARQIAEYAKIANVSKIVLGRTNHRILFGQTRRTLTDQVSHFAPDLDIYIIPDTEHAGRRKWLLTQRKSAGEKEAERRERREPVWLNFLKTAVSLGAATGIGLLFKSYQVSEANIIMIYLLGVLLLSMSVSKKRYSMAGALLSVLLFNYFFTRPYYSMKAYDPVYPFTFAVMFMAAFVISTLMSTVKRQGAEAAKTAWRTQILLENSRKLRRAKKKEDVIREMSGQMVALLGLSVAVYLKNGSQAEGPFIYPGKGKQRQELSFLMEAGERSVAEWVLRNGKRAGCCTHTLLSAAAVYLPVKAGEQVYAAVGIVLEERRELSPSLYGLVTAMLNETALVFDRVEHTQDQDRH